jgi:pimeloyl-ACP methyl ester carboxylesterase
MTAMTLPLALTKLSYLIDNPWVVSQARADMAGLILADSIIDRNLGTRPITLVGFSLGARVIFSCLKELAARGAFGLVQNVYMFGTPVVAKNDEYIKARSVVPGRFVNGYATNDWILGKLVASVVRFNTDSMQRLSIPCHIGWYNARRGLGSSRSPHNRKRQRD